MLDANLLRNDLDAVAARLSERGYTLDRVTGALLVAEKFDPQVNWATHVDMKSGRPHRVPLPLQAVELLTALPRFENCDLVFPSSRMKPLSCRARRGR